VYDDEHASVGGDEWEISEKGPISMYLSPTSPGTDLKDRHWGT